MRALACFANVTFALAFTLQSCARLDPPQTPSSLVASVAPEIAGEDLDGVPFRLSDYRGKVVVLGFGYTSCPNVCPVTLAVLAQAHRKLGTLGSQVQFIYLTVDPERDTPEVRRTRREVRKEVDPIEPGRLVFVDETGVTTAMTPSYGRAPRGERVEASAPASWESVTVIAAMGLDGVRAPLALPG